MLLLTLLLNTALAQPASASLCKISAGGIATSSACVCVRRKKGTMFWRGGVEANMSSGPSGPHLASGTCFDNLAWEPGIAGYPKSERDAVAALIDTKGLDVIWDLSAANPFWDYEWQYGTHASTNPASIIIIAEGMCYVGPNGLWGDRPKTEPMPGHTDLFDDQGSLVTWVLGHPSSVSEAMGTFINGDNVIDLLITFEDGDVWEAYGPFDPNNPITPPL